MRIEAKQTGFLGMLKRPVTLTEGNSYDGIIIPIFRKKQNDGLSHELKRSFDKIYYSHLRRTILVKSSERLDVRTYDLWSEDSSVEHMGADTINKRKLRILLDGKKRLIRAIK